MVSTQSQKGMEPGQLTLNQVTNSRTRRSFLRGSVICMFGSVTGCLGADQQPRLDHPAAANLENQPQLGRSLSEVEATIIVFEDPSCPTCQVFEERTFPKLRSELIDAGKVALFAREYPIVAPWGEIGSQALEAVFDRSDNAFWGLRSYYYASQGQILSDVLYEHTEKYLENNTDLKVQEVIEEIQQENYKAAVHEDVEAAREAEVPGTPTFFLFKSDEYLTEIAGAPSYKMLKNALGF